MLENQKQKLKSFFKNKFLWLVLTLLILVGVDIWLKVKVSNLQEGAPLAVVKSEVESAQIIAPAPQLDFAAYDKKLNEIANPAVSSQHSVTSTASSTISANLNPKPTLWPVKTVYPNYGALLPFNRIVAYYGNLYSKGMGVLGEYPENVMLDKLSVEVKKWQDADPTTPVIPALHYIAVVAQAGTSKTGKYIARMPDGQIDQILEMAKKINGVVFLDIQLGQSNI
jgi:hypothetical protein